jgi:hypothetical protein
MALFFSAEAKERPGQAVQVEIENLRAELQRTKDTARLRARHPSLTDDQVDVLLAEEADMVIRKAQSKKDEELNKQNQIRLDGEYRKLACDLVKNGSILLSVDRQPIKTLTPDLLILCPMCGKPLNELSGKIYEFAKMWYWADQPGAAIDRMTSFTIYSARSPLTEYGVRGHIQHNCTYCRKPIRGVIQMVLV